MKFVSAVAGKAIDGSLIHPGLMKKSEPPMNPPHYKPDPFAPKRKENKEPVRVKAPTASSVRGDPKEEKPITNADIMALLLKLNSK